VSSPPLSLRRGPLIARHPNGRTGSACMRFHLASKGVTSVRVTHSNIGAKTLDLRRCSRSREVVDVTNSAWVRQKVIRSTVEE